MPGPQRHMQVKKLGDTKKKGIPVGKIIRHNIGGGKILGRT